MKDIISAPRTDAIYNMHSYLTKVPVKAIIPFIEEYCPKDGYVVDMFAGSGMTAIAAKIADRNAIVSDISNLGNHIGKGYLQSVDSDTFKSVATTIVSQSKKDIGWLYNTIRQSDEAIVESIRTVWSYVYECEHCSKPINYYESLKEAKNNKDKMVCSYCHNKFVKKNAKYINEKPVLTVVKEKKQVEQPLGEMDFLHLSKAEKLNFRDKIPSLRINSDREMYKRSALDKWDLTETKNFFSQRNSAVLYDLWNKINKLEEQSLKTKLKFCFTAILPRASKRYQWSAKAPLNAANQNYYIAPVFYEWNVYELFLRKVNSSIKSDNLIQSEMKKTNPNTIQDYVIASADNLSHINDGSVDLVFTDPPFGSNIFYSDMNLFQEAWLGHTTDNTQEAVIRTTVDKQAKAESKIFYKEMLKRSFCEAYRILSEGGHLCVVFGNSKGNIWSLAQEAFTEAGFYTKPVSINILDKGQRSVKGLNSGNESVATLDLIVTLKKPRGKPKKRIFKDNIHDVITLTFKELNNLELYTASHVYLEALKNAIYQHINVSKIDLKTILEHLKEIGFEPDPQTGKLKEIIENTLKTGT